MFLIHRFHGLPFKDVDNVNDVKDGEAFIEKMKRNFPPFEHIHDN